MNDLNQLLNEAAQMFDAPPEAEPAPIEPPVFKMNTKRAAERIDYAIEQQN